MPGSLVASERLHIAMGVESEAFDVYGQLVVLPWHMPLPRELQRQPQPKHSQDFDTATNATNSGRKMSMISVGELQIAALQ